MKWTPDELKQKVDAMTDLAKCRIVYGVTWSLLRDHEDRSQVQYINTDHKPDIRLMRETVDWLIKELTTERPELRVKEVIRGGELEIVPGHTFPEILEMAAECLNAACSWDICGEVLFKGDNDRYYVGTVEFVLAPANPAYVEDTLKQTTSDEEEEPEQ